MNAVTKVALALGLLAGAALVIPEAAFARGGGGGGGGKSAGGGGGKSGAPKSGGTGKGGKPGSNSKQNNAKGRGDFLQDMQRDEAADCRGAFLDDATLEVIRTRRMAERGE